MAAAKVFLSKIMQPTIYLDQDMFPRFRVLEYGIFVDALHNNSINQYDHGQGIIVDVASNPWDPNTAIALAHKLQSTGLVAAWLISDRDLAQANRALNVRWYPSLMLRCQAEWKNLLNPMRDHRTFRVSCLNREPRLHRAYAYYLLSQRPWFDEIYRSFFGLRKTGPLYGGINQGLDELVLRNWFGKDCVKFFRTTTLPYSRDAEFDWQVCIDPNHPAFADSYVNVVTETSWDQYCPTEKTFKAIAGGCITLPVACKDFVFNLNSWLGFDLNYTLGGDADQESEIARIDRISDNVTRIRSMIALLDAVYENLHEVWQDNRDRLEYNRNHLMSNNIVEIALQDVQDLL